MSGRVLQLIAYWVLVALVWTVAAGSYGWVS